METFRKAELRKLNKDGKIIFFKAFQWDNWVNEKGDPEYEDIEFFTDFEKAIEYCNGLIASLNLGWEGIVEKIIYDYDYLNEEISFRDEISLKDLYVKYSLEDTENVYQTNTNKGKELDDNDIIVEWNWETYIGYARKITKISYVKNLYINSYGNGYESDLANNTDRTFRTTQSLLLTESESKDMCYDEIMEEVHKRFDKCNSIKNINLYEHKEKIEENI
jgi:hypothetical protein